MDQALKNDTPLVSVILPVYNAEKYLRDAVRSILDQSHRNFELIVIDDGSTDNSAAIINGFTDNRITVIKNGPNLGLITSLNKGIELASGKYIARMDADDISAGDRFAKQVEFMETRPAVGLCGSDYYSFSGNHFDKKVTLKDPEVLKTWLLFTPPVCHPSVMIRASILKSNHLRYDHAYKHVEDYELWTRIAQFSSLANIDEFLLYYRDHAGQVSHRKREEQIVNSKKVQRNYLKQLGFAFAEHELVIHNLISSNARITTVEILKEMTGWLNHLVKQNSEKHIINTKAFNYSVGRIFYDCCGNTSLGMEAYRLWRNSTLRKYYGDNLRMRLRLMAKCLIRKFR
jgi:glycosyltransferase involved in cell wall biosynthesis